MIGGHSCPNSFVSDECSLVGPNQRNGCFTGSSARRRRQFGLNDAALDGAAGSGARRAAPLGAHAYREPRDRKGCARCRPDALLERASTNAVRAGHDASTSYTESDAKPRCRQRAPEEAPREPREKPASATPNGRRGPRCAHRGHARDPAGVNARERGHPVPRRGRPSPVSTCSQPEAPSLTPPAGVRSARFVRPWRGRQRAKRVECRRRESLPSWQPNATGSVWTAPHSSAFRAGCFDDEMSVNSSGRLPFSSPARAVTPVAITALARRAHVHIHAEQSTT